MTAPSAMDVTMTPIDYDSALFVAANMRERDRREIYATRWNEDPAELAADCAALPYFAWTFWLDGVPAGVIGGIPCHPGLWSVYAFGTPDFRAVSLPMSRHVRRVMIPGLLRAGANRAECRSLAIHTEAHRWLEMLGAKREGDALRAFGKNGEDFFVYRWVRDEVENDVLFQRRR